MKEYKVVYDACANGIVEFTTMADDNQDLVCAAINHANKNNMIFHYFIMATPINK